MCCMMKNTALISATNQYTGVRQNEESNEPDAITTNDELLGDSEL